MDLLNKNKGVIVAVGGLTGGYSLLIKDGRVHHDYNSLGTKEFDLKSGQLPKGEGGVYSLENLFISFLPVEIFFPGLRRKDYLHSISCFSLPLPSPSSLIDSRRRLAFLGLFKR